MLFDCSPSRHAPRKIGLFQLFIDTPPMPPWLAFVELDAIAYAIGGSTATRLAGERNEAETKPPKRHETTSYPQAENSLKKVLPERGNDAKGAEICGADMSIM